MSSDGYFQAFGPPKTNKQLAAERADTRMYEEAEAQEQRRTGLDVNGFPLRTNEELFRPPMPEKTPEELKAYWVQQLLDTERRVLAGGYWTPLDAIFVRKRQEEHGIILSDAFEAALRGKLYWLHGGAEPKPQSPMPYEQHAMGFTEQ